MNTQILLIILFGILSPMMIAMGYGKIEWAQKGKNPGGKRDERMRSIFKFIGFLLLFNLVVQLYIYFSL